MLLDFTVENYRSFNALKSFSLEAQKLSETGKNNVFSISRYNILRSLAIYGANSSGKSNLIMAMNTMKMCVLLSQKMTSVGNFPYDPFLLSHGDDNKPTLFEVSFLKNNTQYRYGFRYTRTKIVEEWLFHKKTSRSNEKVLFIRNDEGLAVNNKEFAEGILPPSVSLNDNKLLVALCDFLGGAISKEILSWFDKCFNVTSGIENSRYSTFSKEMFHQHSEVASSAMKFFSTLQLGFNDIVTREEEINLSNVPDKLKEFVLTSNNNNKRTVLTLESVHNVYDKEGNIKDTINFSFDERESAGTEKLFDLSGPIFDTLQNGTILVIDELDAKMHPLISQHIVSLFNSADANPNNAQLIFTTHDTHLLSSKQLRRDQIWFTEKDDVEQTDLYCLTDIVLPDGSKPRNDANYERNYIKGRYGAIPYIND